MFKFPQNSVAFSEFFKPFTLCFFRPCQLVRLSTSRSKTAHQRILLKSSNASTPSMKNYPSQPCPIWVIWDSRNRLNWTSWKEQSALDGKWTRDPQPRMPPINACPNLPEEPPLLPCSLQKLSRLLWLHWIWNFNPLVPLRIPLRLIISAVKWLQALRKRSIILKALLVNNCSILCLSCGAFEDFFVKIKSNCPFVYSDFSPAFQT